MAPAVATLCAEAHALRSMMEHEGGVFDWAYTHNSPLELSKLTIMDFSLKSRVADPLVITCRNTNRMMHVHAVVSYKFLGVYLDPKLQWATQTEHAVAVTSKWVNAVCRLAQVSKGIPVKYMRMLYISVAIPCITYMADVWYTPPYKPQPSSKK